MSEQDNFQVCDQFSLPENNGYAYFSWPHHITQEECEYMLEWLELIKRKLHRFVITEDSEEKPDTPASTIEGKE